MHCSFQVDAPVSFVLLLCVPWVLLHVIIRHPRYHRYHRNFSFVTANKPPWIFPWLIPWARASRLITPWIILSPLSRLSPLLWRHGYYAKGAGALKCSNLKWVPWIMQATQILHHSFSWTICKIAFSCSSPPFARIGWCSGSVMEAKSVWLCTLQILHYSTTLQLQN